MRKFIFTALVICIGPIFSFSQIGPIIKEERVITKIQFSNDCLSIACTVWKLTIGNDRKLEYGSADSNNVSRSFKDIMPGKEYDDLLKLIKKINTDSLIQFYNSKNSNLPIYTLRIYDNFGRQVFIGSSGSSVPEPLKKVHNKLLAVVKNHGWN